MPSMEIAAAAFQFLKLMTVCMESINSDKTEKAMLQSSYAPYGKPKPQLHVVITGGTGSSHLKQAWCVVLCRPGLGQPFNPFWVAAALRNTAICCPQFYPFSCLSFPFPLKILRYLVMSRAFGRGVKMSNTQNSCNFYGWHRGDWLHHCF